MGRVWGLFDQNEQSYNVSFIYIPVVQQAIQQIIPNPLRSKDNLLQSKLPNCLEFKFCDFWNQCKGFKTDNNNGITIA